ncbi:hypothetical protein L226DRAFT_486149 [Lentinus tigrinus ALCF2SS1-7]|uniref:Thioesterase/thiol ester dehydrase-isomerase n=1 Tax=Lentinus tigrinus ALCF2SS1-6 TaxID=1328759 RepID=A0A5C2SBL1_9APHY|nr:hypothetical protein L227DRAFT_546679 [Lentinus tigrinus ALCF2SS1-6]RPD75136.1 hypothetical protein L226DRAFT_486149 [Lentinus tigrinus ALCF2SS1-7]
MAVGLAVVLRRFAGLSATDLVRVLSARSLQYAPKVVKYFVLLLFLIQVRSWPLVWHWVVWRPVFAIRGRYLVHRLSNIFSSAQVRRQKNLEWLEGLSKVGSNPFDLQVTYRTWAGPDDCDFNMHLSNSSYPKRLDAARFTFALEFCPTFFRVGGWMGLGATHFTFLREIPMFSHYEMRTSVMSWDNKWIYAVTRFVTKPKKGKGKKGKHAPAESVASALPPSAEAAPNPSLHTANGVAEGTSTPYPPASGTNSPPTGASEGARALAAQLMERPEPDGALINCLAVSEVCCKIGRITVPPALVFAIDGFCADPPQGMQAYSRTNPPPHWETVRQLRGDAHATLGSPIKGSLKGLRDFYTGGWRDVPEGQRWWETALGAEVEERRLRGLPCMQALRKGIEEARTI